MATDTSSRAAAGNCQTESPVRADIALSPGAEQLATAIDIVWPKHLCKIRKPRSPQLRNLPKLVGFAKLLDMPRAPAQISLDASHRLGRSFLNRRRGVAKFSEGGMLRRDVLTPLEPRSTMTHAAGRVGLLLLAVVLLTVVPTAAGAKDTVAFTIKDARITESSGLAVDPGGYLYWTVNDSDDRGVAYGIGLDGSVRGTLNFDARPHDVEAVAVHKNRLYVADIGDNNGRRRFVRVYVFTNPRPDGLTVTYHAYDFRYPDGPQDAETLLINDSGRLFIVTKGRNAAIYEAPAKPERQGVNELEQVGSAPPNVTDGAFLLGRDRIALLTPSSMVVIGATSYKVMATVPIPDQPQAESVTLSLDQRSLLVGSEGKKSKVYAMRVPSAARAKHTTKPRANHSREPNAPFTPTKPPDNSTG